MLELFSLREELPRCRAALSVYSESFAALRVASSVSGRDSVHCLSHCSQRQVFAGIHAFEDDVIRAALRTLGFDKFRNFFL